MTDDLTLLIIAAKHCKRNHSWLDIMTSLGISEGTARGRYTRRKKYPEGTMPAPCPICGISGIEFEENNNLGRASVTSERIKTLDQLLAVAQVDTDKWQVRDWGVKKWEVGAKIKTGHLEWQDGKIDGHLDYKGLGVQDLWSVWAKFIRREPVFLFPTIQPVRCDATYKIPKSKKAGGVRRTLIGADAQLGYRRDGKSLTPFHDRKAISIFLQVAEHLQPDMIILLGDWNDAPELTDRFWRSPDVRGLVQPAIEEGHWIRRQLRANSPESRILELEGNHDNRLLKNSTDNFLAAADLKRADCIDLGPVLSWPYLMALDSLGIEWIDGYPDNEIWINDNLRAVHGDVVSNVPGGTARKMLEDAEESVIFGHIHRRESASITRHKKKGVKTIEARSVGCLCDIGGAVPARSKRPNWQQSFAIVEHTDTDYMISDVEIRNGKAIWGGIVFEGIDYVDSLRKDNDRWNW